MIRTRANAVSAERGASEWTLSDADRRTGAARRSGAKVLVNAAGPWVADVLAVARPGRTGAGVRLVQGIHIVVRRLYEHDRCYIFQNADNRIIFAIPYEHDFTLIGTTDQDYVGDPAGVRPRRRRSTISAPASEYFAAPVEPADVVWTYSGVRPLYDDGASEAQEATRDYVLSSTPRRRAAAVDLRRQDHDLPPAR